jgi:hypothetical protein
MNMATAWTGWLRPDPPITSRENGLGALANRQLDALVTRRVDRQP